MQHLSSCPICNSKNYSSFIQTKAQMHPSDEVFNFDQCKECLLVFLNPRVDEDALNNYYTDYYLPYRGPEAWGTYSSVVVASQKKLDARRAEMVNQYHPISEQTKILDVGCGKPTFLEHTASQYTCHGYGIDFSDNGWKDETERFKKLHLQVGEIGAIEIPELPDVITMWHYLEHDYKPIANLTALRKLVKKDTTLIFEVPNFESESRQKYQEYWAGWHTPRHTSLFSSKSIYTLLDRSGWKVKEILSHGTLDPYVLYWMSKMEKKGISWNKNMETEFLSFVSGLIPFTFKKLQQKSRSLGVMTIIAQPA